MPKIYNILIGIILWILFPIIYLGLIYHKLIIWWHFDYNLMSVLIVLIAFFPALIWSTITYYGNKTKSINSFYISVLLKGLAIIVLPITVSYIGGEGDIASIKSCKLNKNIDSTIETTLKQSFYFSQYGGNQYRIHYDVREVNHNIVISSFSTYGDVDCEPN